MNNLNTLIKQYWAGELKLSDKMSLVEMLEEKVTDLSDDEYRAFIQLVNEEQTLLNKQNPVFQERLIAIKSKLNFVEDVPAPVLNMPRKTRWLWLAAASIVAIVTGIWLITGSHSVNKPVMAAKEPTWITVSTGEIATKDTTMPDGSIIKMYAGTSISFIDGFRQKERTIRMTGRAFFQVARDTSRPFIVYAGGFTTKALGTEFEINTQRKGSFSVHLLKGKVVVKTEDRSTQPMEDVYLLPNDQLEYDLQQKTATLNRGVSSVEINATKEAVKEDKKQADPELMFSKLTLPVIFKQLEDEYAIVIVYDTDKVGGMEYSGTFKKSENPFSILKKIARQYNLKVKKEPGVYKIE